MAPIEIPSNLRNIIHLIRSVVYRYCHYPFSLIPVGLVIPAEAGIQKNFNNKKNWIPAYAGMIYESAGMTYESAGMTYWREYVF